MIELGLASITFREREPSEIVELVARTGLDRIEWAATPHLPPGDRPKAREVRRLCEQAGISCPSYGSYLRCVEDSDAEIDGILKNCAELGAGSIRVWAGTTGSAAISNEEREQIVANARSLAQRAKAQGVSVSFEYHRNTLNDDPGASLRLLDEIGIDNVSTYWQPATTEEDDWSEELQSLLPRLGHVHAFSLSEERERLALADQEQRWRLVLKLLSHQSEVRCVYLEFVQGDDPQAFLRDASELVRWRDAVVEAPRQSFDGRAG